MEPADPLTNQRLDDPGRLAAIARYDVMDTPAEAAFDALAALAADLCDAPSGLVSLVDAVRQFNKASSDGGAPTSAPADAGFCPLVVRRGATLVIPDTAADPAYRWLPAARGGVRFYAGVPLVTEDAQVLGAICVFDTVPRAGLTVRQERALATLADEVIARLELRRALRLSQDLLAERSAALEEQRLLGEELSHRIKNVLAMVQAIVNQTLRRAVDTTEALAIVGDRLAALARAQDVFTRSIDSAVPIAEIVRGVAQPAAASADRVVLDGGDAIDIGPRGALYVTLALHELATNAVKYGALSDDAGLVEVAVRRDGADGVVTWTERGGPAVSTPTANGFGTRLIGSVGRSLGGTSTLLYDADGVRWELRAPVATLSA